MLIVFLGHVEAPLETLHHYQHTQHHLHHNHDHHLNHQTHLNHHHNHYHHRHHNAHHHHHIIIIIMYKMHTVRFPMPRTLQLRRAPLPRIAVTLPESERLYTDILIFWYFDILISWYLDILRRAPLPRIAVTFPERLHNDILISWYGFSSMFWCSEWWKSRLNSERYQWSQNHHSNHQSRYETIPVHDDVKSTLLHCTP